MRYKNLILGAWAAAVVLVVACSSANFGGTTTAPSKNDDGTNKSSPSGSPTNDPTKKTGGVDDPGTTKCSTDQVKLKLSTEQEQCIVDQGKTWDFKNNRCGSMPKAEFECNWQNVLQKLGSYSQSLVTPTLQKASTDGSKLVTCGQATQVIDAATNKRYIRYAVQFISADAGGKDVECEGKSAGEVSITTGCYTYADNGADPINIPPSTDQAAYADYVYKCIDNLAPTP